VQRNRPRPGFQSRRFLTEPHRPKVNRNERPLPSPLAGEGGAKRRKRGTQRSCGAIQTSLFRPSPACFRTTESPLYSCEGDTARDYRAFCLGSSATAIDRNGLESALQDMSDPAMSTIETLGIDTVDLAHTARERRAARFDQQSVMVAPQAIRPQRPVEPFTSAHQAIQKSLPILVIDVDRLAYVAARRQADNGVGLKPSTLNGCRRRHPFSRRPPIGRATTG
jgi:hypothetical protein